MSTAKQSHVWHSRRSISSERLDVVKLKQHAGRTPASVNRNERTLAAIAMMNFSSYRDGYIAAAIVL